MSHDVGLHEGFRRVLSVSVRLFVCSAIGSLLSFPINRWPRLCSFIYLKLCLDLGLQAGVCLLPGRAVFLFVVFTGLRAAPGRLVEPGQRFRFTAKEAETLWLLP